MKLLAPNVLRLLTGSAALLLASASLATSSFSTVVIDPGHGGFDRGGIPGQRVPEKNVALDTALRLQRLLQQAGLHTVLTRSTDVFIPLPQRVAIANAQPQSIFVSIHYNAARRQGAHGIETYFEDSRGAALAARIQLQIISRVSADNRGIRHATYYVLRKCQRPAVLVECGFLTNPGEAQLALTARYRQMVAEQIAAGILEQRHFAFPAPSHRVRQQKHHKSYRLARKSD
jgi:N-acetylmuramoyl-L-alanine amidase